jgi:hypothetical protein
VYDDRAVLFSRTEYVDVLEACDRVTPLVRLCIARVDERDDVYACVPALFRDEER